MDAINNWDQSPFHAGEQEIQSRMNVRERMETFGRQAIRPFMPDQHQQFYGQLPMIVAGSVDDQGWPWASMLFGKPGFITAPDDRTLAIDAKPVAGDPLAGAIRPGAPLGLLGIELATRRRNRVNVHVNAGDAGEGLSLAVDQAFGNCPQYIQTRATEFVRDPAALIETPPAPRFTALDDAARQMIASADTFFVASYASASDADHNQGVDVSHRGGQPGFVRIDGNVLTVPDYAGNLHFNTLGNFLVNPKAGLLFVDFETGDMVQLTGTVELIWDDAEIQVFRGAERAWRFTLDQGQHLKDAAPLRWSFGAFSPNSLITGTWEEAAATLAAEAKRDAWRDYRVVRIHDESDVIRSFYLEPADGDGLFQYQPGQYLTIKAPAGAADAPLIRTYTLSSAPADRLYRISVKREPAASPDVAPGAVSNHLHDTWKPGDIIQAKAPRGDFTLDASELRPAVLIAGGVGITPMVSMARHIAVEGVRTRHARPLTVFHAAKTTSARAFHTALRRQEAASGGTMRYFSLVSEAGPGETAGADFNGTGRITAGILQQTLPLDDYDFYLCGPPRFMQAMYDILRELGVRDTRIYAEAFGPASITRQADPGAPVAAPVDEADQAVIKFTTSQFEQGWAQGDGTLLEFAEAHGLAPEYGCRSGACGSCAVKLNAGVVAYRNAPTAAHGDDEVLICCAVPAAGSGNVEVGL